MDRENLGPAERILHTLMAYSDHLYHNRPGMISAHAASVTGVLWEPVTTKREKVGDVEKTNVYKIAKVGVGKKAKSVRTLIGVLDADHKTIRNQAGAKVGEYRVPGVFPEVAAWAYQQVAEVWKLDNEFAARWASYAFADKNTSRDMSLVLAAFMLCQSRRGDPVLDQGKVLFLDDDYRNVGEAMALLPTGFDLKRMLRIKEILNLEAVAKVNHELGFGRSTREAHLGRWPKVATKWLRFREQNPQVFAGLLKSGYRQSVRKLAKSVGYKPLTPIFFKKLRWGQKQATDGRRSLAIGEKIKAGATWADLTEKQICERITQEKPTFKQIVGKLPEGLTRAIMMAAIEAGSVGDKDLIILVPTIEELGLHKVQDVQERLAKALRNAEDQRAANIARNVHSKEVKEALQEGADNAVKAAVADVVRGIRIYFMVDISASMNNAIEQAKTHIEKFLGGFPQEQIHISVFNTSGREIVLKSAKAAGVTQAFRGITAGGGTDYGAGVRVLQHHKPKPEEDVLFIFVGDEEANAFTDAVRLSGLNPLAFGFIKVRHSPNYSAVTTTAAQLGIPCFMIDEKTFTDPYMIPRTIRNLVAATPVGQGRTTAAAPVRVSLVDTIMKTELLKKPVWAEVG